jgi:type III pantothenate kinase
MNLIIDIGNTSAKLAVFLDYNIRELFRLKSLTVKDLKNIKIKFPDLQYSILSTVKDIDKDIIPFLSENFDYFLYLDEYTSLPIENLYKTKKTLGKDRIAAAVGANNIFPDTNVLVIDAGSALTLDFVTSDNRFIGGNISPGLNMRYKALHHFTENLPLLSENNTFDYIGNSTESAIISGVQQGIIFEIDGYINYLKLKYPDLKVILTGGDSNFFEKKLKNTIFVNSNLTLIGLNRILEYNVQIL